MKKIIRYILIVALVVLATVSVLYFLRSNITQQEREKYQSDINDGDKSLERMEYADSLNSYVKAADIIPQKVDAYEKILQVLVIKGRFDDAKDVVDKSTAILASNDKAKLYLQIGKAYYNNHDFEKAEKYLLKAVSAHSTDETNLWMGKAYIQRADFSNADKYLGKVKAKEGGNALEATLLKSYLLKTDVTSAKGLFSSWDLSLEKNKELVDSSNNYLKLINALSTDDLYNRTQLARIYINQKYPSIAVSILESEVDKMKEYPDGLYFLARAYYDQGKYSSALDTLNQSLGYDTYADEIYLLIARVNLINNDLNATYDAYEKSILYADNDKKIDIYKEYINVLLANKAYSNVKLNLDKMAKITTEVWVDLKYAQMYYEQKNSDKLYFYISKMSKVTNMTDTEKMDYLRWLITYDIENDKLAAAKEMLNTLRSLDRYNPQYYLLLGRVYLIESNTEKAKENLEKAINYDLNGEATDSAKKLLSRVE